MSNAKVKKNFSKSVFELYNNGKYGKIDENSIDSSLINIRVVSEDYFGTVKYVGNIPKSTGMWLGIDWDDPSRGRHNGTHNGVKYFETVHEKSGSFVRPNKVSRGLTIEEAIDVRYGSGGCQDANFVLDEFYLESSGSEDECGTSSAAGRTNSHQKIKVNISGPSNSAFNINSGMMNKLKSLILHSLPVYRSMTKEEPGEKLGEMVPLITELDLAQTLIHNWVDLANICRQLPKLVNLNISDNKLIPLFPSSDPEDIKQRETLYKDTFKEINHLVMVRLYYTWIYFFKIFDFFPYLKHLCLAYNKLSTLNPVLHDSFTNLVYLDLACNSIDNFQDSILPFGALTQIETLLLNENKITEIIFPGSVHDSTDLFPKLKLLAISNNLIDSWDSLHHVGRIDSLRELIFMFNPILERQKNIETARQDIIAKIARLKLLNRNEIKYEERKGAEIDYLKRYGKAWLEAQPKEGDDEEVKSTKLNVLTKFFMEHPRFMKLVDLYGGPEQSEVKEVTHKLREKLIEVNFEYPDKYGDIKSLKKKIPGQMTVQHLRALLRRICKLSGKCEFDLSYISNTRPDIEIQLAADTREIGFYNVQEGDRVIVRVI